MANQKEIPKEVLIAAICGITILEAIALCMGYDGYLLTAMVAVIAGLAGWTIPNPNLKK